MRCWGCPHFQYFRAFCAPAIDTAECALLNEVIWREKEPERWFNQRVYEKCPLLQFMAVEDGLGG